MQTLVINVITPILYYKTVALFGFRKALRLFNLWVPTGPGRGTNLRASREAASEVRGMRLAANRHHATTYSCTVWVPKHTGSPEHACDNAVGIGPIPARLWYITRIRHGAIITLLPHHSVFNRKVSLLNPPAPYTLKRNYHKYHVEETSFAQDFVKMTNSGTISNGNFVNVTFPFHCMCLHRWFSTRLQYLHCWRTGDTAVLR